MVQTYPVEVQPDFIERQAKAQPVPALAELIWNALDADATRVTVEFGGDGLGGMSTVVVSDNGEGIPYAKAPELFRNLGGSWKMHGARTTTSGRALHGQEGRGRFKAFAIGSVVDWKITYRAPLGLMRYEVSILESDIKQVRITDEKPVSGQAETGVTVVISGLKRQFPALQSDGGLQDLAEIFAIYLKNYRHVLIEVAGQRIDPTHAVEEVWERELPSIVDEFGVSHAAALEVIGWRRQTKRALYLCNEDGFPLSQVEARFHVGDFQFSAYLKSGLVTRLQQENQLDLAEMVPALQAAIDQARDEIKTLYRQRAAERAKVVVDEWIERDIYPFKGEPDTSVSKAERQIFDIVAVTVQDATPGLREASTPELALHLQLLKHAIERSPKELQRILSEVLKLPPRTHSRLATLLEETSLAGIISAASVVTDRLKFLTALEAVLFDPEMRKRLRERSQLHKILETNTWIFGEEFNLWVSDRSLTEVLRQHRRRLDPSIIIDEPVRHVSQKTGIVDLMLSRAQRRHRADDFEHLVVELKAPKVVLSATDLTQLEGYAASVAEDRRFGTVRNLKWYFWLVSDSYNRDVELRLKGHPEGRSGIVLRSENIAVGVKTWAEIIEENRARLQFFQESLEHRMDRSGALKHLQEKHRQLLEGVVIEEPAGSSPGDGASSNDATAQPEPETL
ncbi:MAG: hypothetical protein EOS11_00120 [Mesorhizobium sp.]|nr:MAG: hypothetical protein EOS11_00120 [Mesorhizobium sp.]